jgi:hypothetical protein
MEGGKIWEQTVSAKKGTPFQKRKTGLLKTRETGSFISGKPGWLRPLFCTLRGQAIYCCCSSSLFSV